MFKDTSLRLNDILAIYKLPFFRSRELIYCIKCNQSYWKHKLLIEQERLANSIGRVADS